MQTRSNHIPFGQPCLALHAISIKDRAHFLSQVSAEMKIEMPKIGARRFKFIQNPLLLCFYAFRVTENHVYNHLEGYINRNSNTFLKDFDGISMDFGYDGTFMADMSFPECRDVTGKPGFVLFRSSRYILQKISSKNIEFSKSYKDLITFFFREKRTCDLGNEFDL